MEIKFGDLFSTNISAHSIIDVDKKTAYRICKKYKLSEVNLDDSFEKDFPYFIIRIDSESYNKNNEIFPVEASRCKKEYFKGFQFIKNISQYNCFKILNNKINFDFLKDK